MRAPSPMVTAPMICAPAPTGTSLPRGGWRLVRGGALGGAAAVAAVGGLADPDAHAVVDEAGGADARAGVDLDPGDGAIEMRDQAREEAEAVRPERMGEAVQKDGVEAGG